MKRLSSFLLALVLLVDVSACGGSPSVLTWQEQYDLGVRYLEEGNYEEAIIAFTAAIEIDPKQAPAYVGRGDAYIGSGETEENLAAAQADYEKAIELDETNANAYLGLADVYIRRGDYDLAEEILRGGLDRAGENQTIADKLAEIEKLTTGSVYPPEESTPDGDAVGFVGEILDLRNVTAAYTTEPEAFAGNEGAAGAMVINATVYGPSRVRNVLIGSWFLDEPPEQDEIDDVISLMIPTWKEEVKTNPLSLDDQVPFQFGQGHPVTPDELNHTAYVLIIGLDENIDAVGYAIVEEDIPG